MFSPILFSVKTKESAPTHVNHKVKIMCTTKLRCLKCSLSLHISNQMPLTQQRV